MISIFPRFCRGLVFLISFLVFSSSVLGSKETLHSSQDISLPILIGDTLLSRGQFERAIEIYSYILGVAKACKDNRNIVKGLLTLGLLYWNIGKLDESYLHYDQAFEIASINRLEKKALEAQKAMKIYRHYLNGKELRAQRKYLESIQAYSSAIKLARELGSRHHELKCIRQKSISHWELSEFEEFHLLNENAFRLAESLNHKVEVVRALNHIGLYFWRSNQYSQALVAYSRSLEIVKLLGNLEELSSVLNNMGLVFKEYGNFEKALEFLFEALKIDREAKNDSFCAIDLINIGTIYRVIAESSNDYEDYLKSTNYFLESLELAEKIGDINSEIAALNNLGDVLIKLGNYEEAQQYLGKGIEKARNANKIYYSGVLFNNIGLVSLELQDFESALQCFTDAIKIGLRINSYDVLWEAYYGLGLYYETEGHDIEASKYFHLSADIIDKLRSLIALDIDKAGFGRDKIQVYHKLVELYVRQFNSNNKPDLVKNIFNAIEKAKARAFLDLLIEANVAIQDILTPELVRQEEEISEQITAELNKLARENPSIERRVFIRNRLDSLEDIYTSFMNRVRVEIPELSELVTPEPCSLDQVQELIVDENTVLLEYFLGEDRSFLIAISAEQCELHELPSKWDMQSSLNAYLKLLSDEPEKAFRGAKASHRLYNELIRPVENLFSKSVENLIIIPDGILYYLPFESLIVSREDIESRTKFLVEEYNVSYMPSASSLIYLLSNMKNKFFAKDLLALGNPQYTLNPAKSKEDSSPSHIMLEMYRSLGFQFLPLPHSEDEIRQISKYFEKERRDVLLRKDANESKLKNIEQNEYRVIHFACHGFVDEFFPSRSALVLSLDSNNNEDGFLLAREIYNLRLGSDMIVLSACQTGAGKIEGGEGIFGLQRVFFFTGARSVVSTLWEIGDRPAAVFMRFFYENLSRGFGKSKSIRLAK